MTLLLSCQHLTKSFGPRTLFRGLSLSLFSGDRVGLIGPNGSGKSTLLKILSGQETQDEGTLSTKRGLKIGYLPQVCEFTEITPLEALLAAFSQNDPTPDYERERIATVYLTKLGFAGKEQIPAAHLSGGWKKRLKLAQELIRSPDLLLLDEPTNHLDLEGILWLENFLRKEVTSYLLVSHDRYFLEQMVNRTIEINPLYPQGLFAIDGPYHQFLEHKELFIQGQLEQERSIASKARKELDWLRASPKARTTKSKSRVEEAHALLGQLSEIKHRNKEKRAQIDFAGTERETKKLLVAKNLSKSLGGRTLFSHLDFTLSPFTRMGLLGANGSGKTTLLRLLAQEVTPDQGTMKQADRLKIVYFDQHRTQLPSHITLREALSPRGDFIEFRGQKIHVNGWCKRFLFSPDLLDMPLEKLSGGEKARISIAHLMTQPADILLLDEPTNDLDIPTLETLEENLMDFPGAVVLITHDRSLMARICNTLLFLKEGEAEFFIDFAQWEASQKQAEKKTQDKSSSSSSKKSKLSYSEKKEYESMEAKILETEKKIQTLTIALEQTTEPQQLQLLCTEIGLHETELERLYLRWEELERKML
jgi:ATP-binding cassette subfamily F protein uup